MCRGCGPKKPPPKKIGVGLREVLWLPEPEGKSICQIYHHVSRSDDVKSTGVLPQKQQWEGHSREFQNPVERYLQARGVAGMSRI